jgi:Icc protein
MTVDFAGHIVISGPSTCSSFAFDRSMDATAGYMIKEEGCLLHRWQNGFQSLRVSTTQGLGPFLF